MHRVEPLLSGQRGTNNLISALFSAEQWAYLYQLGTWKQYQEYQVTVHNTNTTFAGSLPLKAFNFNCLFLRQLCRDVASVADRHLVH